ncbi:MAG: ThuA domain-containing protein [Planctomycetota bacterium]
MKWLKPINHRMCGKLFAICLLAVQCSSAFADESSAHLEDGSSVDILLVTSGCCHDYDFQTKAMQLALRERGVAAKWTVVSEGGTGTSAQIDLYDDPSWAKEFDLVIHNECFAKTKDEDYIRRITKAHYAGVDAVVIHCAMHTYREAKIDDWREFLGVTSRRHEHKSEYPVTVIETGHPIMKDVPKEYTSAYDELYIIEKVWPNTQVLATSTNEKNGAEHAVFWTNRYGKANVFGTTYGHSKETFEDEIFLDILANAVRWLDSTDG